MTTPYRDDHGRIQLFTQHIGVAIALLEQFQAIPSRMASDLSHEHLEQLKGEARVAWEGLWEQLAAARAIAAAMGRPLRAYDDARKAAGDIWLRAAEVRFGPWRSTPGGGRKRTVTWLSAPVSPAQVAINALRAAVPQAVIATSSEPAVDLRSHGWLIDNLGAVAGLGIVAGVVALVVYLVI